MVAWLVRLALASSNAAVNAVTARLAGGSLRLFAGDPPDTADTAPEDQQLLAELRWPSPAFPAAANGISVSFPLASGVAIASGNPSWAQAVSAGGDVVFDESVNQGDDSMQIEPAWIEAGGAVVVDHIAYSA